MTNRRRQVRYGLTKQLDPKDVGVTGWSGPMRWNGMRPVTALNWDGPPSRVSNPTWSSSEEAIGS
jgi:hypothetical protein